MSSDPLQQMQQFLEAQQRLWEHISQHGAEQGWNPFAGSDSDVDRLARAVSNQAQAYGNFAKDYVEALQKESSDDPVELFIQQFRRFRDQLQLNEAGVPEGFTAFFSALKHEESAFSGIPFLQGQWSHQLERIKQRFTHSQQALSEFQKALSHYQSLEQELNQAVYSQLNAHFDQVETQPEKLREYVDLWVDIYETAYQQHIQSIAYQDAYKNLISASAALQQKIQQSWDEEYRTFGLVPVEDYDQLLKKQHLLQKQVRQQQLQIDQLAQQIAQLLESAENGDAQ